MDDLISISSEPQQTSLKERAEQAGAVVLAGMAMLVSVELVLEHAVGKHGSEAKSGHSVVSSEQLMARAEGKGETARLPEEFDIGLQTPGVAGV